MRWRVYVWVRGALGNNEEFTIDVDSEELLKRIGDAVKCGKPISVEDAYGSVWRFKGGEAVVMKAVEK